MRALLLVTAAGVVGGGCVVVKPPSREAQRPMWRITGDSQLAVDCVIARAEVRKSGKQGIGIALELKARDYQYCSIEFPIARLAFSDDTVLQLVPPPPQNLDGRSRAPVWWPIAFDNNAAWNAGHRRGRLQLGYKIGGELRVWEIAMEQQ